VPLCPHKGAESQAKRAHDANVHVITLPAQHIVQRVVKGSRYAKVPHVNNRMRLAL
jgi:hypothetical protein